MESQEWRPVPVTSGPKATGIGAAATGRGLAEPGCAHHGRGLFGFPAIGGENMGATASTAATGGKYITVHRNIDPGHARPYARLNADVVTLRSSGGIHEDWVLVAGVAWV